MNTIIDEIGIIDRAKKFVNEEVIPRVQTFEKEEGIEREFFKKMANNGFLGLTIPKKYGGLELDYETLGKIHQELGKGYCSVQNAITVYGMFCKPLSRFGSKEQKAKWLPKIVKGETIVSIAITEPDAGSNIREIKTEVDFEGDNLVINGKKKYITLAQIADLYLVLGKHNGKGIAFLIERNTPGFEVEPIHGLLGLKANMLAELHFNNCIIPKENIVGKPDWGLNIIAPFALDEGRFTTACGCIGLGEACLEESLKYSKKREQFSTTIDKHELVQKMITDMIVNVRAAKALCSSVAKLRDEGDPSYINDTLMMKYFASKLAVNGACDAVQIQGASGCVEGSKVERYYRDSKIMEIIEGTTQVHEIYIAKNYVR